MWGRVFGPVVPDDSKDISASIFRVKQFKTVLDSKMKAQHSFETSTATRPTTRRHDPHELTAEKTWNPSLSWQKNPELKGDIWFLILQGLFVQPLSVNISVNIHVNIYLPTYICQKSVNIYLWTYICQYICQHTSVNIYLSTYICQYTSANIYMSIYIYQHISVNISANIYLSIYLTKYLSTYICQYISANIYLSIYICRHISVNI